MTDERPSATAPDDPYLWLEEVEGAAALAWVEERNAEARAALADDAAFARTAASIREVLDSAEKIPDVSLVGDLLYNFWRDADHPRGLWRRTTLEEYRQPDPRWETVLDLDALNAAEGEDWVWHGASVLRPDCRRALVDLSHGGSDADETREIDLVSLRFVPPEEGGFHRPEGKGGMGWIDEETVFVYTDLGPGTLTTSGYPRTVRRWRRGTPLDAAPLVHEADVSDLSVSAGHDRTPGYARDLLRVATTFYTSRTYLLGPDGSRTLLDVPESASVGLHREWLLVELREDWEVEGVTHPAGALLAARLEEFLAGRRAFTAVFTPTPSSSLAGAVWTRRHLVLTVLTDVASRVEVLTPPAADAGPHTSWARGEVPGLPTLGSIGVRAVDPVDSDAVWLLTTDFLHPTTLSLVDLGAEPGATAAGHPEQLKRQPAFFDTDDLTVTQHFATSDDGTRIPYFQVARADLPLDGTTPTLLYGYGGFEISLTPSYSGALGRAWLEQGGAYVLANIRGGGEYGPRWHQAALRDGRHRAFEDFAAVARDLHARGVTSPAHLGIQGGSNGGLLTGAMLTTRPELFGAVVIQVPLLDMRRYHLLLAGASWMAEYGDPDDPEDWSFLARWSPYQLLTDERSYPPVLLTTSTRDDRVHPGHARKFAARLRELGHDVTTYENTEGGHGGAADNAQAAFMSALVYRFLAARLGLGDRL